MIQFLPAIIEMLGAGGVAGAAGEGASLTGIASQVGRQAVVEHLASSASRKPSAKDGDESGAPSPQTRRQAALDHIDEVLRRSGSTALQGATRSPSFAQIATANTAPATTNVPLPPSGSHGKGSAVAGFAAGSLMTTLIQGLAKIEPGHVELAGQLASAHFDRASTSGMMEGFPSSGGQHQIFPGTSPKFREAKDELGLFGKILGGLAKPIKIVTDQFTMLPRVIVKMLQGFTEQAEMISENNRDLSMWNGKLAASFAQLDLVRQQMKIEQAGANEGSASSLNQSLADLERELQPLRSSLGTVVNVAGIVSAQIARGIVMLGKMDPLLRGIGRTLEAIEKFFGGGAVDDPLNDDLRALRRARPAGVPDVPAQPPLQPRGPRAPLPPLLDPMPGQPAGGRRRR